MGGFLTLGIIAAYVLAYLLFYKPKSDDARDHF